MKRLSLKSLLVKVTLLSFCFAQVQAMDGGEISPRSQKINEAHAQLEAEKALKALDEHIRKCGYKTSHSFVDSEATAQQMIDTFPHEDVKTLFEDFIKSFSRGLKGDLLFKYTTLIGEPGLGKTTIGYAVAKLIKDSRVIEITGEKLLDSYKNGCERLISDFFTPIKAVSSPVIVIVDEFDKTIKKTQVKDFQDKDFLHLYLKAIDQLPSNVLVIMTGNEEINFNDSGYAEDRLIDSQFILGKTVEEQRELALKNTIKRNKDYLDLSTDEIKLLVKKLGNFNLRKIDRLFKVANLKKHGDKITYDDLLRAAQQIESNKKGIFKRSYQEFKTNDTLRYFLYGLGATLFVAGSNILYQHINHHYFIEPANQVRHVESLVQQSAQHAESLAQQAEQHDENTALGILGLGIAAAALIGAKGGGAIGGSIETVTAPMTLGSVTGAFACGGAVAGVGYWLWNKI